MSNKKHIFVLGQLRTLQPGGNCQKTMNNANQFAASIKAGDEKAFELFFKMEFNNVVHFINAYINMPSVAKDIAQETFIAFWNKRQYLNENLNIRSYLFKTARNKTLNYIRDNKLSTAAPSKEALMDFYALADEIITDQIDALKLEELINRTYTNLPEDIKNVFYMNRVKGFTYAQIADQRQVPVKAIEYQIKKALQLFRKRLKNHIAILILIHLLLISIF